MIGLLNRVDIELPIVANFCIHAKYSPSSGIHGWAVVLPCQLIVDPDIDRRHCLWIALNGFDIVPLVWLEGRDVVIVESMLSTMSL